MESETTSLEDIFNRDDKGRFAPRQTVEAEAPAPVEQPAPVVEVVKPEAAAAPSPAGETPISVEAKPGPSPVPEKVESEEVKGLKAELARLRSLKREATPAPRPEPVKPPSVFEDEEGFTKHIATNVDDMVFERVLGLSEYNAREKFTDFAEVMGTESDEPGAVHLNWVALVQKTPGLFDQFKRHPHPVAFAYEQVKKQRALSEIGDPEAYKTKLRAELEAKIRAELLTPNAANVGGHQPQPKPEQPVPTTLAGTASKAAREAPEFSGPKPLSDIIASAPFNKR